MQLSIGTRQFRNARWCAAPADTITDAVMSTTLQAAVFHEYPRWRGGSIGSRRGSEPTSPMAAADRRQHERHDLANADAGVGAGGQERHRCTGTEHLTSQFGEADGLRCA
jgi:hypothetical protein